MKKSKFSLFIAILAINIVSYGLSLAMEHDRGVSLTMRDYNSDGYSYPSFKFFIKTPAGEIIGWDENKDAWTGDVKESHVRTATFTYPDPEHECTSTEEYKIMVFKLPSGVEGDYVINNALYCKNVLTGENSFIASGYAVNMGNALGGNYEIHIIPNKSAMVEFCFDFSLGTAEPVNMYCDSDEYIKQVILTPQSKQTLEISYSGASLEKNKLRKVVTPTTLVDAWEGCKQLGLIKNQGIYKSINKKLIEAKKKLDASQRATANNIIKATINEIEAQKGKGVSAECANILVEDLKGFEQ